MNIDLNFNAPLPPISLNIDHTPMQTQHEKNTSKVEQEEKANPPESHVETTKRLERQARIKQIIESTYPFDFKRLNELESILKEGLVNFNEISIATPSDVGKLFVRLLD